MATLYIDSGNTRLKWRYRDQSGALPQSSDVAQRISSAPWGRSRPGRVVVAAVRRSDLLADLLAGFKNRAVSVVWARTRRRQAGLRCTYDKPSALGVDRWLAAIAGWHTAGQRCCVVVDCGTAVTVDAVTDAGVHLGGYIVPGRPLMADALGRYTERVRVDLLDSCAEIGPGTSTEESVNHGLLAMLSGLVERTARNIGATEGREPMVLLCGGGAPALADHAELPTLRLVDNLVLDGLRLAYPD